MINFTSITRVSGGWQFTWAGGTGEVRVVLYGALLATTSDASYTYPSPMFADTVPPPIEVVPSDELASSEYNRSFLLLQWYPVDDADRYEVELWSGTAWQRHGTVSHTEDDGVLSYSTPLLPDMAETRWRVVAVADNFRESSYLEFRQFIVRPPNPPTQPALACSGGTLTVG